jgi:hypothetical protein
VANAGEFDCLPLGDTALRRNDDAASAVVSWDIMMCGLWQVADSTVILVFSFLCLLLDIAEWRLVKDFRLRNPF